MNNEILQMRNELALLRRKSLTLQIDSAGFALLLRNELPVHGDTPILRTDTTKVLEFAKRLSELKADLVKTLASIKSLEEELGPNE